MVAERPGASLTGARSITERSACATSPPFVRPSGQTPRLVRALALAGDLAGQLEVVPDRQARFGLVQGVEVQTRRAAGQQLLAHLGDDLLAEGLDAVDVVSVGLQLLAHQRGISAPQASEKRASLL